jgi:hypothetical protein
MNHNRKETEEMKESKQLEEKGRTWEPAARCVEG